MEKKKKRRKPWSSVNGYYYKTLGKVRFALGTNRKRAAIKYEVIRTHWLQLKADWKRNHISGGVDGERPSWTNETRLAAEKAAHEAGTRWDVARTKAREQALSKEPEPPAPLTMDELVAVYRSIKYSRERHWFLLALNLGASALDLRGLQNIDIVAVAPRGDRTHNQPRFPIIWPETRLALRPHTRVGKQPVEFGWRSVQQDSGCAKRFDSLRQTTAHFLINRQGKVQGSRLAELFLGHFSGNSWGPSLEWKELSEGLAEFRIWLQPMFDAVKHPELEE